MSRLPSTSDVRHVGARARSRVAVAAAITWTLALGCATRPTTDAVGADDPESLASDRPGGLGLSATPAELGAQLELHLSVYRVDPALWSTITASSNKGLASTGGSDAARVRREDGARPGDVFLLSELRGLEVVVLVLDERNAELEALLSSLHLQHPRVACVLVVVNDSIAAFDGLALGYGLIAWDPQGVTMAETGIEQIPGWSVLTADGRVRAKGEGIDTVAVTGALASVPLEHSGGTAVARSDG